MNSSSPMYVYYDLSIRNFESNQNQILRFTETRNTPLVTKSNDYLLSIVRFQIDTFNLPVFFCDIQKNQADPNLTPYSIVINYEDKLGNNVTTTPTYVVWQSQHVDAQVPLAPSARSTGYQDFSSDYYYAYTFNHFITLINQCFKEAFDKLVAVIPPVQYMDVPFLAWDESSNKASLYVRQINFDPSISIDQAPKFKIYFNQQLQTLFNSFPYLKYDSNPATQRYEIVCNSFNGLNIVQLANNTFDFIKVTQEFSTVAQWSLISSLIFCSNILPVTSNQLSSPIVLDNGTVVQFTENTSSTYQNIITDMAADENFYKPNLLYVPDGEYRFVDLVGQQDIRNIEVTVYWRDKLGYLRNFYLPAGGAASMKLMFKRKY